MSTQSQKALALRSAVHVGMWMSETFSSSLTLNWGLIWTSSKGHCNVGQHCNIFTITIATALEEMFTIWKTVHWCQICFPHTDLGVATHNNINTDCNILTSCLFKWVRFHSIVSHKHKDNETVCEQICIPVHALEASSCFPCPYVCKRRHDVKSVIYPSLQGLPGPTVHMPGKQNKGLLRGEPGDSPSSTPL